jgi:hypothetical protein
VAVAAVAVGTLSIGAAGVAGAAPAPLASAPKIGAHFHCARATKVLTRIERTQATIASGLPGLQKAEAKAKAKGKDKRANRIDKLIKRLENPALPGRLTKAAQAIEAKCHVSAPTTTSAT